MRALGAVVVLFVVLDVFDILGLGATALACPPTVTLTGDERLVAGAREALEARGIAAAANGCSGISVLLNRRGSVTVVSQVMAGGRAETREVTDMRTAATVIESWVTDVEAPLLRRRSEADAESPNDLVVAAPAPERPSGVEIFTLGETSFASDGTTWVGFEAGACAVVGRFCLGGRARYSTVADGPYDWEDLMEREAIDGLLGLDMPMRFGRLGLSPGIAMGLGWIRTHEREAPPDRVETRGLRSEAHFALSYRVLGRFAAEAIVSVTAGRTVSTSPAREKLPDDPPWLARVGLGLRFEGL
jgi:hypothetical protein